jgi:hypothetical protein
MDDFARRDLFAAFGETAPEAPRVDTPIPAGPPYGAMSVARHQALAAAGVHVHVYHGDEDITTRCRFADDTGESYAELFKLDAKGQKYWDSGSGRAALYLLMPITMREGAPFHV